MVRLRWPVMRLDSSHVMTTAATASSAATIAAATACAERSVSRRMTRTTSPTSRAPATTTDSTHRHVLARRRMPDPSVTSARTAARYDAPPRCTANPSDL